MIPSSEQQKPGRMRKERQLLDRIPTGATVLEGEALCCAPFEFQVIMGLDAAWQIVTHIAI